MNRFCAGWVASLFLSAALSAATNARRDEFTLLDQWLIWSDPGTMVIRQLTDQNLAHVDRRAAAIAQVRTRDDWLSRQQQVRATMEQVIGTLPHRHSPLNPRVMGVVHKPGYRIEKIVFESLPGMPVTGCLLIPDAVTGRAPTILYTAGSNLPAFRAEQYQQHILNLVRHGYIVFAIDPIGQGERVQHYDATTGQSAVSVFNHIANQCFLIGTSYAKYYIRDAVRALDYLETRPEVDAKRLGMGGHSWGGWQCTIVSALEPRIAAAASAAGCNVGVRRWLESRGASSAGQHYPNFVAAGLDHADFHELIAPRAFLRMSTSRDYKVIQGDRETFAEYRQAFAALGAAERLDFTEDDAGHGYTPKNNEAAYRFYGKQLAHGGSTDFKEMELMSAEDMRITPTGQVATSFTGAAIAFDFNREEALPLLQRLEKSRQTIDAHLVAVRDAAKRLAGVDLTGNGAGPVFLGRHRRSDHAVEMYAIAGESGYMIPLLLYVPVAGGPRPAIIYVHTEGKAAAIQPGGAAEQLVRKGYVVAVPDVAGTGETANRRGGSNALQYIGLMINRSMVGLQAGDVIRVRAFLQSRPEQHEISRIAVFGVGSMGATVMHAAALDAQLAGVVLERPPLSYRAVVVNGLYAMEVGEMVASALTAYDLPDLLAAIAPRRLALIEPVDHMLKRADEPLVGEELRFTRAVYARKNAAANFRSPAAGTSAVEMADWVLE